MKVSYVDLVKQHQPIKKEILRAIDTILSRGDFILGESVAACEADFARYVGVKHAIGVNSGTDALILALAALNIGAGDEVITTSNSFLATAMAIVRVGAKPVFCDVDEDMNMDPQELSRKINGRTRAVIPVHLTGKMARMEEITKIARKKNLKIIEDAAQAIGASRNDRRAGSFGDINAFSLHPLKTLNAVGDGGMMTTQSSKLAEKIKRLRNIGLKNRIESEEWGYNSRLDSLQAAVVRIKLQHVDRWIARRKKNAAFYTEALQDVVLCPQEHEGESHAWHLYVIRTPKRDALEAHLKQIGVDTRIHYPIPIHLQKCARHLGYKRGDFPKTEQQSRQILSLPIHQDLTGKDLQTVVQSIRQFFSHS